MVVVLAMAQAGVPVLPLRKQSCGEAWSDRQDEWAWNQLDAGAEFFRGWSGHRLNDLQRQTSRGKRPGRARRSQCHLRDWNNRSSTARIGSNGLRKDCP